MPKWKPARGSAAKKPDAASRARQVGCIFWLVAAFVLVMLLFYAVVRSSS